MAGVTPLLNRPKPIQSESLFSYLTRLCMENEITLPLLLNFIRVDGAQIQSASFHLLDINPSSLVDLNELARLTGCQSDRLLTLTVYNVLRTFAVGDISRGRFLSGLIRDKLHFCPSCLRERNILHLGWRFAEITMCTKHVVYLHTGCQSCGQEIKYSDIREIGLCPYCAQSLAEGQSDSELIDEPEQQYQVWLSRFWIDLSSQSCVEFRPNTIALKLLYLLTERQPQYCQGTVTRNLDDVGVVRTLLQHARGTLSQNRTLHLRFILHCLFKFQIFSLLEFAQLEVPDTYIESVYEKRIPLNKQHACLAPWCSSYDVPGSLVKTGTKVKQRNTGEKLKYYMFCTACGCEYAFLKNGELIERTYFIEFYNAMLKQIYYGALQDSENLGGGFTRDRVKRCVAYFSTRKRGEQPHFPAVAVEEHLLKEFILAVENGSALKSIERWACWCSYEHFLGYRFHQKVMLTLNNVTRTRKKMPTKTGTGEQRVMDVIQLFMENDIDITLGSVCEAIGVCPETIRSWGCNNAIAQAKREQRVWRLDKMKVRVELQVNSYLNQHRDNVVHSSDIYNFIGTSRIVIWRMAPQITCQIAEKLKSHNKCAVLTANNPKV